MTPWREPVSSGLARDASGKPVSTFPHPAHSLAKLMAWLSPSYPVGAFSYSSGIEWAVETGDIATAASLREWIESLLRDGGGFCDAVFFVHAYRAALNDDLALPAFPPPLWGRDRVGGGGELDSIATTPTPDPSPQGGGESAEFAADACARRVDAGSNALRDVAELAAAFTPSRERHLETTAQGRAFLDTTRNVWPCAALDRLVTIWDGAIAYPVAVAVASAGHEIPLPQALSAYLHAVVANWISAGVRLVPLGQTDGQRVLAALAPVVAEICERALVTKLDDVGGATFRADLASLHHETQYTRLFRS